jgi:phage shock protein E
MDWQTPVIVAAAITAFLLWKKLSVLGENAARAFLKQGAKVIDVRTPGEFSSEHLPDAVNLPLGDIAEKIARAAPDKNQVLLLHCLAGGRSGMAVRKLKGLGYRNVYNLGGYRRAKRIVQGQAG